MNRISYDWQNGYENDLLIFGLTHNQACEIAIQNCFPFNLEIIDEHNCQRIIGPHDLQCTYIDTVKACMHQTHLKN